MENLEQAIQAVKEQFPGMKLLENEPMKAHSSFRIGGHVRALAVPSDVTSLTKLCDILKQHHIAPFILGNGTNILFPDEGLNDLFIISTEKLQKLFHEHGLICRVQPLEGENPLEKQPQAAPAPTAAVSQPPAAPAAPAAPRNPDAQELLVVNKTVRGGQEIRTQSSVLVCGNVNPGAQIIAGGSIDVRGICRGMVHAGAFGDTSAIVVADHLMPTQIRIAGFIARSPDQMDMTEKAERASIKDGQIVIEPIER
jgi:septum site-determining protein MinC